MAFVLQELLFTNHRCFTCALVSARVFTNFYYLTRRQDSSIGFGAPVRANMRTGGITDSVVTSSLLESVSIASYYLKYWPFFLIEACK